MAPRFGGDLRIVPIKESEEHLYAKYLGGVQAGFPSPAEDMTEYRLSLDEKYLSKIESTYILEVSSDSMTDKYQIGDRIITRSDFEPQHGDDIVVSINNSEYTLKQLDKKNSKLIALNKAYPDIEVNELDEVIVLGIVIVIIREVKKLK